MRRTAGRLLLLQASAKCLMPASRPAGQFKGASQSITMVANALRQTTPTYRAVRPEQKPPRFTKPGHTADMEY